VETSNSVAIRSLLLSIQDVSALPRSKSPASSSIEHLVIELKFCNIYILLVLSTILFCTSNNLNGLGPSFLQESDEVWFLEDAS
jgi:hypothetical protein